MDFSEEIYMKPLFGMPHPSRHVCHLCRLLDDLKKAPRAWFPNSMRLFAILAFSASALFYRYTPRGLVFFISSGDDMIITGK